MKKIFSFAAALAVIFTASCNKEMNPSEGLAPEGNTVKVTMNVTAGDPLSKMVMNGNQFAWEIGDEVIFRFAGGKYNSFGDGEILTAKSSGQAVTFEGNIAYVGKDTDASLPANAYAFYANQEYRSFNGSSSTFFLYALPNRQTGKIEDVEKFAPFGSYIPTNSIKCTRDNENNVVGMSFDAEMVPYFSLVRLNVPASLGLTSIEMSSSAKLAGILGLSLAKTTSTAIGSGSAQLINRPTETNINTNVTLDKSNYTSVRIERNGDVISGDVYFVILPDAYDKVVGSYCSSASSLTFTFTSGEKSVEFSSSLSDKIYIGEIKNLGSVPANIMVPQVENPGTLCMLNGSGSYSISVKDPIDDCKYYYEVASSYDECLTPTINSTEFDPMVGFSPEMTGTHDVCFIKVLAHSTNPAYRDVVLKAELRNWKFNADSPLAGVLNKIKDGGLLAAKNDEVTTSDGLNVFRRAINNTSLFVAGNESVNFTNDILVNMVTNYSSNVYVFMCTSNYYCITSGGSRTFYICHNNGNRTNDLNGTGNTRYQITRPTNMTDDAAAKESFVWNLGKLNKADKVAFLGDGNTMYYGIAMLEVL